MKYLKLFESINGYEQIPEEDYFDEDEETLKVDHIAFNDFESNILIKFGFDKFNFLNLKLNDN